MSHLTIRDADDLARLARRHGTWQSIAVDAGGIDPARSRRLAGALARGERPCGCIGARIGLAAGLAGAITLLAWVDWTLSRWAFAAFGVLLASAAGRWLEIDRALYARRRAARELHAHFAAAAIEGQ